MKISFLTFEGIDGAGKTTQIELLHKYLSKTLPIFTTREPGGTGVGEKIRDLIKTSAVEPMTELFLFYASRTEHVNKIILPMLNRGYLVICDRFIDSTEAYQSYGRGIDKNIIQDLNRLSIYNFKPDLTIFIDIPVDIAMERSFKRGKPDLIEAEKKDFYLKVSEGYKHIIAKDPDRFIIINGLNDQEKVFEEIKEKINKFF